MRIFFVAVACASIAALAASAQGPEIVDIRLTQPPPNQLRIADLWRVQLNNRSGRDVQVRLHGTAEETSIPDGLIVEATTRIITVPPGVSTVNGNDVQPIKTENEKERYRDALLRTGSVPTGDYTICCEVISVETDIVIGRDCKFIRINRISQPVLITPPDESEVEDLLPVFTWMPGSPLGPGQRVTYRLRVAEMFGVQTPFDAIERNPAFLHMENLIPTVFQYPVSARKFEKGRRYAWMITAFERTPTAQIELGVSEVWSFTYTSGTQTDIADDPNNRGRGDGTDDDGSGRTDLRRRGDAAGDAEKDATQICPGENWDFEIGSTACWTPDGDAWHDQPVLGAHPVFGDVGQQRKWWLTSFSGSIGDAARGTLLSQDFKISQSAIGFLASGTVTSNASVDLLVERLPRDTFRLVSRKLPGSERDFWIAKSTSTATDKERRGGVSSSDRLVPYEWDVRPFINRLAHIVVNDQSSVGHVNFDDVRFYDLEIRDTIRQPVLIMAAGERHSLAVTPEPKLTLDLHASLNKDVVKFKGGGLANDVETVVNETSSSTKASLASFTAKGHSLESFVAQPSVDPPPVNDKMMVVADASATAKHTKFVVAKLPKNNIVWGWGSNVSKAVARAYGAVVKTPQVIAGVKNVEAVAAGMGHSLAVGRDGKCYVWGLNDYYQLGLGPDKRKVEGQPVPLSTLKIAKVAAGARHTLVLGANGYVYFCGYNKNGEAGLGATRYLNPTTKQVQSVMHVPVLFPVLNLMNIVDVAAGANHSVALGSSGAIYSWGVNTYGQTGADPDDTQIDKPVAVTFESRDKALIRAGVAVAAGDFHSLALMKNGKVYSWGGNASGQLGDGTTKDSHTPRQVLGLDNIRAIAAGSTFSLALDSAGRVWGWGNNAFGQLGTGDRVGRLKPVQVTRIDAITGVVAGGAHSLAVRVDGGLWTWGSNEFGQLGEGPVVNVAPVPADPPLGPHRVEKLAMP